MTVVDDPDLLPPPRRSFYQRHEALILGGSAVIVALAVWEWLWEAGKISPLFFTGPSQVVQRFAAEWAEGRLKQDMLYSGRNFAIGVVVGEMFGGSEGIGYMVNYGGQTFQTDTVFLGVVIIAFAGIVLTWLAERLERHFSRWRPER